MFGKVMSIPDTLMLRYFWYLTTMDEGGVRELEEGLKVGKLHPRDTKARLAREIVQFYHGEKSAKSAEGAFDRVFKDKKLPENMPEVQVSFDGNDIGIVSLLKDAGLTSSKSEARRLIEQGGVYIDGARVGSADDKINKTHLKTAVVVRCGKRKFARVKSS